MAFSFCFDGDIFSIPIYGIMSDQTGNSVQSVQRRHPMSSEHHQQDRLMDIIKRGGLFHSCRKKNGNETTKTHTETRKAQFL